MANKPRDLLSRLSNGGNIIVAEGYLFEFERRGYLKAGHYVPEVVAEHPELVKQLHREFVHAGSEVVLAFTYYAHRSKLRYIGREHDLETMNRQALRLAREVADETGTLMAGNICNTTEYDVNDPKTVDIVRNMFNEQVEWAVSEGADFIVGETFNALGEAVIAAETIKKHGLPAVITMAIFANETTFEGNSMTEAAKKLVAAGADVVGLNCARGPATILRLAEQMKLAVNVPIAVLPVCYRTNDVLPCMQNLKDDKTGVRAFPDNLDAWLCGMDDIKCFGKECQRLGMQYVGICCGNSSHALRTLAESFGRTPLASRYSTDMSTHFIYGRNEGHKKFNQDTRELLSGIQIKHPEEKQ